MVVYIHGFNSSARSYKARLVRERMAALARSHEFACPELPHRPRDAIALLGDLAKEHRGLPLTLIGSSLGGYYATWLAEHHGLRTVLLNPAVRPYALLEGAIGRQTNLYTEEQYDFTDQHLRELRELEVDAVTAERYLLMVQTADEVLDYRDAVEKFAGCEQLVIDGGDHGFSDFERYLDRVLGFCGVAAA